MKAAIYTRVADTGSDADQLATCERYAAVAGLEVVARFSDLATKNRAGRAALLEAGQRGEFGAVVVTTLDRLSRDREELDRLQQNLDRAGIKLHEGEE